MNALMSMQFVLSTRFSSANISENHSKPPVVQKEDISLSCDGAFVIFVLTSVSVNPNEVDLLAFEHAARACAAAIDGVASTSVLDAILNRSKNRCSWCHTNSSSHQDRVFILEHMLR